MWTERGSHNESLIGGQISRREAIRCGMLGVGGLLLGSPLPAGERTAVPPVKAKAKSVIQVWLWGGACHIDTFDPKPGAGSD